MMLEINAKIHSFLRTNEKKNRKKLSAKYRQLFSVIISKILSSSAGSKLHVCYTVS